MVHLSIPHFFSTFFLESIQEQLGEAERKGLRAAFGLTFYTHRQS